MRRRCESGEIDTKMRDTTSSNNIQLFKAAYQHNDGRSELHEIEWCSGAERPHFEGDHIAKQARDGVLAPIVHSQHELHRPGDVSIHLLRANVRVRIR
jgi:hypothetical protein